MNATTLSIVSIAVAIIAITLMAVFALMYVNYKKRYKDAAANAVSLRDELFETQGRIVLVSDKEPDDKRANTAVMKLQNELSKMVFRFNGKVGIWVLKPKFDNVPHTEIKHD